MYTRKSKTLITHCVPTIRNDTTRSYRIAMRQLSNTVAARSRQSTVPPYGCNFQYFAVSTNRTINTASKVLTLENINPNVSKMDYAVDGPLVLRANELQKQLREKKVTKPFRDVIRAHIGDCHAMGQTPITFIRQVLVLTTMPELLDSPDYPEDAKARARDVLACCQGGSVGSYTTSLGLEVIRRHAARYIERRDGVPSSYHDVVLSGGASDSIKNMFKLLNQKIDCKPPGFMIPIPQFPLYSCSVGEFNVTQINYYLDETNNWALSVDELERAISEAKKYCAPRALIVINPGNPTGQVLSRDNIERIIQFAHKERLFLFADEVYQDNVYAEGCEFYSFKKVMSEMGPPFSQMELASVMSCSKGYMGECGLRGAYCEVINLDPRVKAMYFKLISAMICPNAIGQVALECVVNPPQPGEESYDLFIEQKRGVLASLATRAKLVADTFNRMPGLTCNPVQGAMYAFPRIHLPGKAIEKAESLGQSPCVFYAFQLLENAGICIVPGAGFGQVPGTYHFRTTILPQPQSLKEMLRRFEKFHLGFLEEYK